MKVLITGCSWVQSMKQQKTSFDFELKSFGGRGIFYLNNYLKTNDINQYEHVVVQLPTPIRNNISSSSTTERFNVFINEINKTSEEKTAQKYLEQFKEQVLEISKLHKNVIFFLYNVGGYPFRHPYDFGDKADEQFIDFFTEKKLKFIYLSFEGQSGFGVKEQVCDDEFWNYYHENNPSERSKEFQKYWSLISPAGVISIDPHPNHKADKIALNSIKNYISGESK